MTLLDIPAALNDCYRAAQPLTPRGIIWHSTGANNPMLRRYVQPVPDHPQREELLGLLGVNPYGNDWCNNARPDGRSVCVHAFIGKLDDGTVAAAQLLPFTIRAWHAGSGRLGSANHDYLSFELCEDAGNDPVYMEAAYRQAVRLSAFLCRQYGLDPAADGVVLSHREAYARGIASNHGDPESWWTRQNTPFTMERARQDIGKELEMDTLTYENFRAWMARYEQEQRAQPEPEWSRAEGSWAKLTAMGIVDGTAPEAALRRDELAAVLGRLGLLEE